MSTPNIIIYGRKNCAYCDSARLFFDGKGLSYDYYDVVVEPSRREEMMEKTAGQAKTVPQIIINGKAIGGYDNLRNLDKNDELTPLLNTTEE